MINLKYAKQFCKEFENIENYQEAISSPEKYDCHHRLEETGLSKKDLIDKNMYYNRPASELIFLTHGAHTSLHHKGKEGYWYGKHHSIETKKKMSDVHKGENGYWYGKNHSTETKKKISDSVKGENNPRYKHICPALLQILYIEQGKSANKISQELGISRPTIIKHLRELNIPIRKN